MCDACQLDSLNSGLLSRVSPTILGRLHVEPLAVAPPTVRRDIPLRFASLLDAATRLGRSEVERAFLEAVEYLVGAASIDDIERELRTYGTLERFLEKDPDWLEAMVQFRERYRDAYEGERDENGRRTAQHLAPIVSVWAAASDAAAQLSPVRSSWWSLERWIDEAVRWARDEGSKRVTVVAESVKRGIAAIVSDAYGDGRDRDWVAKTLRVMDGDGRLNLGLDVPRSRVLAKYARSIEHLPEARRAKLVEKRYQQLLRARAKTIAQTEVMDAANSSQLQTFAAAAREGELSTEEYVIEWIARALRCPRCEAMDGSTREILSGRFVSDGSGPKGVETIEMPDLHPRGWCFTRLIPRVDAKRQPVSAPNALLLWSNRAEILMAA